MVARLEADLMDEGCLLKTTDFVDQDEADIEDLVGWELYAHLVNESLGVPNQHRLPAERPEGPVRVAKAVEQIAKVLPSAIEQLNHHTPAAYLHTLDNDQIERLPGLGFALKKFEALFKGLNSLIR